MFKVAVIRRDTMRWIASFPRSTEGERAARKLFSREEFALIELYSKGEMLEPSYPMGFDWKGEFAPLRGEFQF